jgi:outer membrane receptor protein involved in Fe transport
VTHAIAAQSLPQALAELSSETGLQILYVSAIADGKRSHAVPAGLLAPAALTILLEGTGLRFEKLNDRAVRLVRERSVPTAAVPVPTGTIADDVLVMHSREQSAFRIPVSARVVDVADVAPYGLGLGQDLLPDIPGVDYGISSQWGAAFYNRLSMRGVVSQKAGVSTVAYLDDSSLSAALIPNSPFTVPYPLAFDIERVEILRGPQGVDYGAGAEAGAVRYVAHHADTSTRSLDISAEAGSIDGGAGLSSASMVVAQPIVEGLIGLRAGWMEQDEGGYVDRINPFTGQVVVPDSNRSRRQALRLSLAIEPAPGWSVQPSVNYQRIRMEDTPAFYQELSDPSAGVLLNGKLLAQPSDDQLTVGALRIEHRGTRVNVLSISSYVHRQAAAIVDETNEAGVSFFNGFGSPLGPEVPVSYADAVTDRTGADLRSSTEEIRISSPDAQGRIAWSAGTYLGDYRLSEYDRSFLVAQPAVSALSSEPTDHTTEQNLFGQVNAQISARWRFGTGIRVGRYIRRETAHDFGYLNGADYRAYHRYAANMPVNPRFELSYALHDDLSAYASVARGDRLGRLSAADVLCDGNVTPGAAHPDSLWSYEVGIKGALADGALSLELSAFNVQWDHVQLRVYDRCGNPFYADAGTWRSRGADLHLQNRDRGPWRWALDLGVTDARTMETVLGPGGVLVALRDGTLAGLPDVPSPWVGTLSTAYIWQLAESHQLTARSRLVVRSHAAGPYPELNTAFAVYDPRFAAAPATVRWNIGVGLSWGRSTLDVYVDNVLNRRPILETDGDYPGTPILYAATLRPRTVGVGVHSRL